MKTRLEKVREQSLPDGLTDKEMKITIKDMCPGHFLIGEDHPTASHNCRANGRPNKRDCKLCWGSPGDVDPMSQNSIINRYMDIKTTYEREVRKGGQNTLIRSQLRSLMEEYELILGL